MKNKILAGLAIVGGLSGFVQAGTVAYVKNSDGTITKQEVLTPDETEQKVAEIRRQIAVLEEQNALDLQKIADRQAQIDDLKKEDEDLDAVK